MQRAVKIYGLHLDEYGCLEEGCEANDVGVNEILLELNNALSIYPNSFSTSLTFETNSIIKKVSIYNLLGEKVFSQTYPKTNLNLAFLPNGIYMLKVETDKGVVTNKIVKY